VDNRDESFDIVKMAEFLKLRKKTQATTLLVLGSRAGGLIRSSFLPETLRDFSTNFDGLLPLQKFAECFHILNRVTSIQGDVYDILRTALQEVDIAHADICVARLAKQGFFNRLVTANIDNILEQAFMQSDMRQLRDFDVFIPRNGASNKSTRFTGIKQSFLVVKFFGDLAVEEYNITSRVRHLTVAENLQQLMDTIRDWNILLVGFDPIWDQHILPALFPRNGTVWYVNEESPYRSSLLDDWLQNSNAQCIIGPEGQYERFFQKLCTLLDDDSDTYRPTSSTGQGQANVPIRPLPSPNEAEQANSLQQSLKAQAQEIRVKEQSLPQSPTVTVKILYSHLPSGALACYDVKTMPLVQYEIVNDRTESIVMVLFAQIEGFSYPRIDTVEVPPQSRSVHYQLPLLDREKVQALTERRPVPVHTRVSYLKDGVEFLYQSQDFDVYLTARNVIRWAVPAREGGYLPLFEHIAAWVTPHKESVKAMIRSAVNYHPQKLLAGYPPSPKSEVPRRQVKAIFQALKKEGKIVYTNSPLVIGSDGSDALQAVRLPDESLREQQANCIDGAVLYASLLEYAALYPVIVIQTGHAFVGWKTWREATSYEFLETTMTAHATFEQACSKGMDNYRYLQERGWFNRKPFDPDGFACLLDIKMLHDSKVFPME